MSRRSWYLFAGFAFAVHNAEEAIEADGMLQFMESHAPGFLRDFYEGITVFELQTNLLILTILGFAGTVAAVRLIPHSLLLLA